MRVFIFLACIPIKKCSLNYIWTNEDQRPGRSYYVGDAEDVPGDSPLFPVDTVSITGQYKNEKESNDFNRDIRVM